MTDSELRVAIAKQFPTWFKKLQVTFSGELPLREGERQQILVYPNSLFERMLELFITDLLTAERTAIKAALPEKLKRGQYLVEANLPIKDVLLRSKNADVYKIAYPQGWNNAIDQVTQVIDGREGV